MCEQTEVVYLEGDIVWVKLGPCWWPGEVRDFEKMEADIKRDFKKPPIAVVKFFQEDSFEYVKNLNNIYKYNCRKKNDFIKKGLDLYRKDNSFMKKFPSDVAKAESLTGGDPEIITSEVFAPERRTSYAQIFGTPSPKKSPKFPGRGRPSLSAQKTTPKSADRRILHPRFVGKSDYGVTMLEQSTPPPVTSRYTCHICDFKSTRLNVIVLHNKSHSSGLISSLNNKKPLKKRGRKSARAAFANTSSIDEDIALIGQGLLVPASDSSESETEKVEKPKSTIKRKNKTKAAENKKLKVTASEILADWGDSDAEEQDKPEKNETKEAEKISKEILADWDANSDEENAKAQKPESSDKKAERSENGKASCFDFEEEEEQTVLHKSPGRKIPRVIPQKRKSSDVDKDDKEVENKKEKVHNKLVQDTKQEEEPEVDEATFKNILEETAVPELPSIDTLETSKNFQERKPIKSPDKKTDDPSDKTNGVFKHGKPEQTESETVTDYPVPKKRFVRNFEDFEMFHNEQKKAEAVSIKETSSLEVTKLKTQLMTKLATETLVKEKPKRGRRKSKLADHDKSKPETSQSEKKTKDTKKRKTEEVVVEKEILSEPVQELHQSKTEIEASTVPETLQEPNKDLSVQQFDVTTEQSKIDSETSDSTVPEVPSNSCIDTEKQDLEISEKIDYDELIKKTTPTKRRELVESKPVDETDQISIEKEEIHIEQQSIHKEQEFVDEVKPLPPESSEEVSQEKETCSDIHKDIHVPENQELEEISTHEEQMVTEKFIEEPHPIEEPLVQEQVIQESQEYDEQKEAQIPQEEPLQQEEIHHTPEEVHDDYPAKDELHIGQEEYSVQDKQQPTEEDFTPSQVELQPEKVDHVVEDELQSSKEELYPTAHDEGYSPKKDKLRAPPNEPHSAYDEPQSTLDEPELALDEPELALDEPKHAHDEPEDANDKMEPVLDKAETVLDEPVNEEPKPTHDKVESAHEPYPAHDEPYPAQDEPYSVQDEPYPAQDEPYPAQDEPYPAQDKPYPAQDEPYPAQDEPYPVHDEPHRLQDRPHPAQSERDKSPEPPLGPDELSVDEEPSPIHEELSPAQDKAPQALDESYPVSDESQDNLHRARDELYPTETEIPLAQDKLHDVTDELPNNQIELIAPDNLESTQEKEQSAQEEDSSAKDFNSAPEELHHKQKEHQPVPDELLNTQDEVCPAQDEILPVQDQPYPIQDELHSTQDRKQNEFYSARDEYSARDKLYPEEVQDEFSSAKDTHTIDQIHSEPSLEKELPTEHDISPVVQNDDDLQKNDQQLPEKEQHITPEQDLMKEEFATSDIEQQSVKDEQNLIQEEIVQEEEIPLQDETHIHEDEKIEQEKTPENLPLPTDDISAQPDEGKSKMVVDITDICIDNTDNLSGLTTLAAVSELSGNFVFDAAKQNEQKNTEPEKESVEPVVEQELVPLEKEATVIEEEVVQESVPEEIIKPEDIPLPPTPKKVATLANFSMDFSDSNESLPIKKDEILQEDSHIIGRIEDKVPEAISEESTFAETVIPEIGANEVSSAEQFAPFKFTDSDGILLDEGIEKISPPKSTETLESEMAKLTDTHPGTEEVLQEHIQNTSSSKLLEILTESKSASHVKKMISPKTIVSSANKLIISSDKGVVQKMDSKNSKFVIKSAKSSGKSNKPIILSEKIIKPVSETESVSVKKVTSKRSYQDVEDIDTFIIQKPHKKANTVDTDMQDIILTPKSELKQIKGSGSRGRGKPKIIEQTIIKAADVPTSETASLLDDSMFDINSMPIVLSDQILTPESLENMPVVMTDLMPVQSVSSSSVTSTITEKTQPIAPLKRGGTLQQVKLLNKAKIGASQSEAATKIPQTVVKNIIPRGLSKNQKVYHSSSTKLLKSSPAVITQPGKPGKFIILPTTTASPSTGSKYTVGKRIALKTSTAMGQESPTTSKVKAIQGLSNEPSGNKIMIVTNNQGVQSRVLLTPAQQKMLAGKVPATKITKGQSQVKGNIIHPKSILTSKGTLLPLNSGMVPGQKNQSLVTQAIMTSKGQIISTQCQTLVTSEGQVLTPLTPQQLKSIKSEGKGRRIQGQRIILPEKSLETTPKGKLVMSGKKTILLKGTPSQTYRKVANTPEPKVYMSSSQKQLLSMGGQQLQQAGVSGKQLVVTSKGQVIKTDKMSMSKASEKVNIQRISKTPTRITKSKSQMMLSPTASPKTTLQSAINIPPLAPITASQSKKSENLLQVVEQPQPKTTKEIKEKESVLAPPAPAEQKHLIIQDNLGNQTTVTEGQILALPRETVDGQPQSYMLVTVDESGNLAPLSNEALMSLEPGLALGGGDLNNLVLQIDQPGATTESQPVEAKLDIHPTEMPVTETIPEVAAEQQVVSVDGQQIVLEQTPQVAEQQIVVNETQPITETYDEAVQQVVVPDTGVEQQTLACNISTGETSQQLIITGDPESTQKFLASLSEGNTDLSSLLTGAEGNIIINTDGQQILLNADPESQILLMPTSTEEDANQSAMFVTQQAMKNQDILAAALADTDVFQQDSNSDKTSQELAKTSTTQSQLSPNSAMYPMNVGNVLETSLTLGSPIMTPLEVPSSKKIKHDIEPTLITQVPSSLELPITITDPSISQTVSQQVMLSNELQSNLELPISVSDTGITSIQSTEMSSPNFVYSLPTLEDGSEIETKTSFSETPTAVTSESVYNNSLSGSMSMPLLTEEPEIPQVSTPDEPATSEQKIDTPEVISKESVDVTVSEQESQPTTSFSETLPPTTFANEGIQDESVVEMTQKISNTLEIIPIENDLDLQTNDMCDSLSEPPPGMFEKSSFLSDSYLGKESENADDIPTPSQPTNMPELDENEKKDTVETTENIENIELPPEQSNTMEASQELPPPSNLSNSEINSPRLDIDENSCEIPIQPTIVTSLSENNLAGDFDTENRKRENEDGDDSDSKRTKLCCD